MDDCCKHRIHLNDVFVYTVDFSYVVELSTKSTLKVSPGIQSET